MLSVSYAGKNTYSAGKTSGVLRVGASGANRCYVLAHWGGGQLCPPEKINYIGYIFTFLATKNISRDSNVKLRPKPN